MKLKKIASLMLAGIMAVSMLAACKSDSSSTPADPDTEVTPVTGAAAAINAELDKNKEVISFKDDTAIEDMMKVYFENNKIAAPIWAGVSADEMDDLSGYIGNIIDADVDDLDDVKNLLSNDEATESKTGVFVYAVNAKMFTESAALKYLGQQIDMLEMATENAAGTKNYSFDGTVSVVKAETKGGEESIWVVALTVTRNLSDK